MKELLSARPYTLLMKPLIKMNGKQLFRFPGSNDTNVVRKKRLWYVQHVST